MSVSLFFNPDLVEQLAACGITARRQAVGAPRGFVLRTAEPRPRGGRTVTNVVAAHGNVTIVAQQLRLPAAETARAPSSSSATEPRNALELVEECARLRRDNQRLSDEVARLRAEIGRLTAAPGDRQREATTLDDSAQRFSLLELD